MEHNHIQTDLLVIGAGPGGYVAAIYMAKKGLDVVLVEKEFVGGTCLNVGCIPTKALVRSADLYESLNGASRFGVLAENVKVDMEKVIGRKDEVSASLVKGIDFLLEKHQVRVIKGTASFKSDTLVEFTSGTEVTDCIAKDIIIATGSKARHLPIKGIDNPLVLDSTRILANDKLPERMVVIGGGIIGMEFAFIYGRLGVNVEVLESLPSILTMVDRDLSQRLIRYAKLANINITTNAEVKAISKTDNGKASVVYLHKGETKSIEADLVLEAVGRSPNTEGLGLENTLIETNRQGAITVNRKLETNVPHIYAIGDVTNIMQLAHVASHQALVACENILGTSTEMDYDHVPSVIFTHPEIATVGKNETELTNAGIEYNVSKTPFSANGKAMIMDDAQGFIKMLFDPASGKVFGASVFGKDAEHLIAPLTLALKNNLDAKKIKDTIFAHPTTAELVHEGYLGLLKEAIHYLD